MKAPRPVAACNATVNADELPPIQMVCVEVGWVVSTGSGAIITAAVFEVILAHPPPVSVMTA